MIKAWVTATALIVSGLTHASVGGELEHFFKNNIESNVTGSHSYESQAAGFASLGSVYARSQVRNIQIAHVDVPGLRSGCGGIDITAGGASFIKSDQIVQFMQSILSSGAGYAMNFNMGPDVWNKIKEK